MGVLLAGAQTQDFRPILDSLDAGKAYAEKSADFKTKITCLGIIHNSRNDTLFYVLTENYNVKAAIQWHGHSRIVFLGKNKKIKGFYSLNSPEELPYKLAGNTLFFKGKTTGTVVKQKISGTLPDVICVMPGNAECFEKEQ